MDKIFLAEKKKDENRLGLFNNIGRLPTINSDRLFFSKSLYGGACENG
jgi:hypothetical protein